MKNKYGFTLVELLAVIAILALLVILALPNVLKMFNSAQKRSFIAEVGKVYNTVPSKYIDETIKGNFLSTIDSSDPNTKLNLSGEKLDYHINLDDKGKVTYMEVSNGKYYYVYNNNDDDIANISEDDVYEIVSTENNTTLNQKTQTFEKNGTKIYNIDCTVNDTIEKGKDYIIGQYTYRYLQGYGAAYNNNGYTADTWFDVDTSTYGDGWGVKLTDLTSTDPVTTQMCTTINNIPVRYFNYTYYGSKATSIDLSKINTSEMTMMFRTFAYSEAKTLDFSKFNTKNVKVMKGMFLYAKATTLDLSTFKTPNLKDTAGMFQGAQASTIDVSSFDTSKVIDFGYMFSEAKVKELDLKNFNTESATVFSAMFSNMPNVTKIDTSSFSIKEGAKVSLYRMYEYSRKLQEIDLSALDYSNIDSTLYAFRGLTVTKGYAKDQQAADKLNASSQKSTTFTFVVK